MTMVNGTTFRAEGYGDAQWELIPRNIPLMERTYEELNLLRRWEGKLEPVTKPGAIKFPIKISANQKVTLLFDHKKLTTAFPDVVISEGKGSEVKMIYAEALFDDIKNKGHRDSINGKSIHGVYDIFVPDVAILESTRNLFVLSGHGIISSSLYQLEQKRESPFSIFSF